MNVTIFKVYLDESGIDKPDVCTVAGFIGGIPALDQLAKRWKKVLDHFKVPEFHAIQFYAPAHKIALSTTNPYRGWSNTKRRLFIDSLLKVIEERNVFFIGTGVDSVAFQNRSEEEKRHLTGGLYEGIGRKWTSSGKPTAPYFLALRSVIETAAIRTPDNGKVCFVMSEQNEYEFCALKMYRQLLDSGKMENKDRLGEPMVFATPKRFRQLQAADLAAYHLCQVARERRHSAPVKPKGIFRRLTKTCADPKDLRFVTKEALDKLCERFQKNKQQVDELGMLRRTRLRTKVSHAPSLCTVIGTVHADGSFHPGTDLDILEDQQDQT